MSLPDAVGKRVKRRLAGDGADWIGRFARLGFVARSLLYAVIGGTALRVAVGAGGSATGSQGALRQIAQGPFGTGLLLATAIGLFGYAAWRLVQTFTAAVDRDHPAARAIERISYPLRATVYAVLGWSALRIALGGGGGGSGPTAAVLSNPVGRAAVALVGAGVVIYGAVLWYRAVTRDFEDELGGADDRVRRWLVPAGCVGYAGRGSAYLLTGGFVVHGAVTVDAGQTRGLDHALGELAGAPSGPWLLGTVAVGLLVFAGYSLAEARYRSVDIE